MTQSPNTTANTTTPSFQTSITDEITIPVMTTESSSTFISVNFVLVVLSTNYTPVTGPTIQFSSPGIETISIPLKNSSNSLHTVISVKEFENVVVMVTKPGYATNAVRWIPTDDTSKLSFRFLLGEKHRFIKTKTELMFIFNFKAS